MLLMATAILRRRHRMLDRQEQYRLPFRQQRWKPPALAIMSLSRQTIAEHEQELGINPNEENENVGSQLKQPSGSRRSATEVNETESGDEGANRKRGRDGERSARRGRGNVRGDDVASDEASQESSDASSEDGKTSRSDGGRASRPVRTPRSDVRKPDGSSTQDEQLLDEEEDQDDPVAMARLRRENRELKARLRREEEERGLQARQPAQTQQTTPAAKTNEDPEPTDKTSPAWDKWKIRDLERRLAPVESRTVEESRQREVDTVFEGAKQEFLPIAREAATTNADFLPAIKHAFDRIAVQMHYDRPEMTPDQLVKEAEKQLLIQTGKFAKRFNGNAKEAMKAMYDWSIEYHGFRPGQRRAAARVEEKDEQEERDMPTPLRQTGTRQQPNLRVINSNRRRSASGLQGGGQSGSMRPTLEAAATMTLGELANLDTDMWDQLENMRVAPEKTQRHRLLYGEVCSNLKADV
ncbi:unnamed protein product [Sphagnum balticum]